MKPDLTLAAKAALHLRSRLGEPRAASIFDSVQFTDEQAECLLALAEAFVATQESRKRAAKMGGEARAKKLTAERRSEIGRNAVNTRHERKTQSADPSEPAD